MQAGPSPHNLVEIFAGLNRIELGVLNELECTAYKAYVCFETNIKIN